ncbi:MAG: hypothetical protein JW778_01780 [Candidatus Altiarchaeota archaeon]|nr:hypothetical protein [Candidatus Altiarchaeota archaeon]
MDSWKAALLIVISSAIIAVAYYFVGQHIVDAIFAALGVILFLIGYLSGFFALLFGVLFSIFYFATSLPIISTLYAWIIFTLSKINYVLFNLIFKKVLYRMKWYRDLKSGIEDSREYRSLASSAEGFLKRLGLKAHPAVQLFQVKKCKNCDRKIPYDSIFCPYCGKALT